MGVTKNNKNSWWKTAIKKVTKLRKSVIKRLGKIYTKTPSWHVKFDHARLTLVFLILFSMFAAWFVQMRYLGDGLAAWNFMWSEPALYWYGVLMIFLIVSLLSAIFWRPLITTSIVMAILSIVTYASATKMSARGVPLLPEDFAMVGNTGELAALVDTNSLIGTIIVALLIVLLGMALNWIARQVWPRNKKLKLPWWREHAVPQRVGLTLATITVLAGVTLALTNHQNGQLAQNDWFKQKIITWNKAENYRTMGSLVGFVYNMGQDGANEIDGYNEQTIASIASYYDDIRSSDLERTPWSQKIDNVIVVLDETFYDAERAREYYPYVGEATPNLRQLQQTFPSGAMYSTEYGGGTGNIEFEIFSGLTNYWNKNTPYADNVINMPTLPTIATYAKSQGFATTAIHTYNTFWYSRDKALPIEGFDRIVFDDVVKYDWHEGQSEYLNDKVAFAEAYDALVENDETQMIGLITMQNHVPYDSAQYTAFDIESSDALWQQYLQTLYKSDEYLGDFLRQLDDLDERTVVLVFGDHAPGILSNMRENEQKEVRDLTQMTPYFVYANFDLGVGAEQMLLPTTTPNCLTNTMYNILNIEKPTLGYLMDEICTEAPILTDWYLEGEQPESTEAFKAYELVNHDLLNGEQYWVQYAKAQ